MRRSSAKKQLGRRIDVVLHSTPKVMGCNDVYLQIDGGIDYISV